MLFLHADASEALLQSRLAVELLAHEAVDKEGIHLLMLGGKGIDAATTAWPREQGNGRGGAGTAQGRMGPRPPSAAGPGSPPQQEFTFMSNHPPGSPEFHAQLQNKLQQQQQF